MTFSAFASGAGGAKNPLYTLLDQVRSTGRPIVDLVRGNVNEHGILYPEAVLKEILNEASDAARIYRPDSFGQRIARQAVAEYYSIPNISADQVLITPGSSVSYWYCFKLLAESGDEILCPRPSYPLFDYIAKLCDVRLTHYRLIENRGWAIDLEHLESQISGATRAIVLISPHNPTGMVADAAQLNGLAEVADRRNLPIISDEVFSEFLYGLDSLPRLASCQAPLVFTLNGLSKMFALPGMKIGWIAVSGNEHLVKKALSALEMISDTFLPVNEIAQFAAPAIFKRGQPFLRQYVDWIKQCQAAAREGLSGMPYTEPKGGFYVTLPVNLDEEEAAAALLQQHGILVHPGYFYDIEPDHLVMTFIDEPSSVREHFGRIAEVGRRR